VKYAQRGEPAFTIVHLHHILNRDGAALIAENEALIRARGSTVRILRSNAGECRSTRITVCHKKRLERVVLSLFRVSHIFLFCLVTGLAEARVSALQGVISDFEQENGRMALSEVLHEDSR